MPERKSSLVARGTGGRPLDRERWTAQQRQALGWLRAACRCWLDPESEETASAGVPGWPGRLLAAVAWQAMAHDLEPLLHSLSETRPGLLQVPDTLSKRWAAAYQRTLRSSSGLLDAFEELSVAAARSGIELIVVKGLATAARYYRDLGARGMRDLDLICREGDAPALCRLLRELGYRDGQRDTVYHLSFRHQDVGIALELHFDVYDVVADRPDFLRRAWERREELDLDGRRIPVLAREQDLAFGLAHLAHHDFRLGLRSYLELAAAVRAVARGDRRAALAEELAACDLGRELRLTLFLVEDLFGISVPESGDLFGPPTPEEARQSGELAAAVDLRLTGINRHGASGALVEIGARPTARARLAYLRRLLLPPRSHLRAMGPGSGLLAAYARHLGKTVGRAWSALRLGRPRGGPSGPSIKSEIHARRHRQDAGASRVGGRPSRPR